LGGPTNGETDREKEGKTVLARQLWQKRRDVVLIPQHHQPIGKNKNKGGGGKSLVKAMHAEKRKERTKSCVVAFEKEEELYCTEFFGSLNGKKRGRGRRTDRRFGKGRKDFPMKAGDRERGEPCSSLLFEE